MPALTLGFRLRLLSRSANYDAVLGLCTPQVRRLNSGDRMQASKTPSAQSMEERMRRSLPRKLPIAGVENTVLVASGKGGVGKSTVAG